MQKETCVHWRHSRPKSRWATSPHLTVLSLVYARRRTTEMSHAAQQILLLPETAPRRCAPSHCSAAVHFSSATDEWETPQSFFDECDAEYHFTLDPCCTHQNAKCAKHY